MISHILFAFICNIFLEYLLSICLTWDYFGIRSLMSHSKDAVLWCVVTCFEKPICQNSICCLPLSTSTDLQKIAARSLHLCALMILDAVVLTVRGGLCSSKTNLMSRQTLQILKASHPAFNFCGLCISCGDQHRIWEAVSTYMCSLMLIRLIRIY